MTVCVVAASCGDTHASSPAAEPPPVLARTVLPFDRILSITERDGYGYPLVAADQKEIRDLLARNDFARLDRVLDGYQRLFEADYHREDWVFEAFNVFDDPDSTLTPRLDAWVNREPGSIPALLAHAKHYLARAWEARGSDWASETSDDQFNGMGRFMTVAASDLSNALAENTRLSIAYVAVLMIARSAGGRGAVMFGAAVYDTALAYVPNSYRTYAAWAKTQEPRWGGSDSLMNLHARTLAPLMAANPRLRVLRGHAAFDQGRRIMKEKKYDEAVIKFTEALAAGNDAESFEYRSRALYGAGRYADALPDADNAVALEPQNTEHLEWRAGVLAALGRVEESMASIDSALAIRPGSIDLDSWKEEGAERLVSDAFKDHKANRNDDALTKFALALKLMPRRAETYYFRGVVYYQTERQELALEDFKTAVALDPKDIDAYLYIDDILIHRGQHDEVIRYWDSFLRVDPGNARGFLERAGTFKLKGDMARSLADLKTACGLGSQEACNWAQRFR
jgi:tetratricopeptide (TPR) repeat protein